MNGSNVIEWLNVAYFILVQVVLAVCLVSTFVFRNRTRLSGLGLTIIGIALFLLQNIGPIFVVFIVSLMPASSMVAYDSLAPFIKVIGVAAAVLVTIGLFQAVRNFGDLVPKAQK